MFGSDMLDAAVGLFFVYLLFSALCSAINEWIIGHLAQLRARTLEKALVCMLGDPVTAQEFFQQPLIKSLTADRPGGSDGSHGSPPTAARCRPSYLSAPMFVDALISLIGKQGAAVQSPPGNDALEELARDPRRLVEAAAGMPRLQETLQSLLAGVEGIEAARARLESWFNEGMDRATGWYKRNVQWCLLVLAVLVTVAFNVNTFTVVRALLNDSKLRASLAAAAAETVKQPAAGGSNAVPQPTVNALASQIQSLELPIGWALHTNTVQIEGKLVGQITRPGSDESWMIWIGGLVITAAALSLGAPFWFDVLNKAVNLRATGRKPEIDRKKKKR